LPSLIIGTSFSSGRHRAAAVEHKPHLGFRVVGVPILRLHPPVDRHPAAEPAIDEASSSR
jgi:hypothetical protein